MTSVADFGEYTGVHGSVLKDGAVVADVQYDIKWERDTVSHARSGKYSDSNYPGKFKVTTKIKRYMVDLTFAGAALNSTATTGSVHTIGGAAAGVSADEVRANSQAITNPSRIRATFTKGTGTGITTAGQVTIIGTGPSGAALSETLSIPLTTTDGTTWTTNNVFKTVTKVVYTGIITNGNGTMGTASIAGSSSYVVGDPLVFTLVGKIAKGAGYIQVTQADCWCKNGGFAFEDAGKVIDEDIEIVMRDPDTLTVAVV